MRPFNQHRTLLRIGQYELRTTSDHALPARFSRGGKYAHIFGVWSFSVFGLVLTKKCDRVAELERRIRELERSMIWCDARHWRIHSRLVRRIAKQRREIARLHDLRKQSV